MSERSAVRRWAAPLALLAGGSVSATWGALAGVPGAPLGAALGALLVLAFFTTGAVPLLMVGGELSRAGLGFVVLLMTYALRLVALLVVLTVVSRSGVADVRWLALTVIALTLVWVGAQVALVGRSRSTL